MSSKSAPTQKQRKQRYPAHMAGNPVRVIGRSAKTGKLWIKQRGMSTRLVEAGEVT